MQHKRMISSVAALMLAGTLTVGCAHHDTSMTSRADEAATRAEAAARRAEAAADRVDTAAQRAEAAANKADRMFAKAMIK